MPASWRGYFINLDRSADRRAAMEAGLARAGLGDAYARFPARDGSGRPAHCRLSPGQYGCFRSHHDLLAGLGGSESFVHVLEDDAVLAATFAPAMEAVIAGRLMEPFDIVFTDTAIGGEVPLIQMLKALFDRSTGAGRAVSLSLIDLKAMQFAATTSFFVNPQSIGRVRDSLSRGLAAGPVRPVDLHIRDEVAAGRIKAGLLFPFLTSLDAALPSTIVSESASGAVSLLLRNAFFVEADVGASRRALAEIAEHAGMRRDDRLDLLGEILRFQVSDKYRPL